jgi:hypothetical protein
MQVMFNVLHLGVEANIMKIEIFIDKKYVKMIAFSLCKRSQPPLNVVLRERSLICGTSQLNRCFSYVMRKSISLNFALIDSKSKNMRIFASKGIKLTIFAFLLNRIICAWL